jgi:hypothetical protein
MDNGRNRNALAWGALVAPARKRREPPTPDAPAPSFSETLLQPPSNRHERPAALRMIVFGNRQEHESKMHIACVSSAPQQHHPAFPSAARMPVLRTSIDANGPFPFPLSARLTSGTGPSIPAPIRDSRAIMPPVVVPFTSTVVIALAPPIRRPVSLPPII